MRTRRVFGPVVPCLRLRTTARALGARRAWRRSDARTGSLHRAEPNLWKGPSMPLYEHVFMARQDVTSQQVESMIDQYRGVIEQNGGKIEKTEQWGVKSLAFRIRKNRKAHFALFNLDAPPAAVAEMERQMRISEDILRFMTVRVDAFEDGPSIMMQKRDRDERKDRERGRDRDGDDRGRRDSGEALGEGV